MTELKGALFLWMLFSLAEVQGQSTKWLRPAKLYEPGERILAPKYGFSGIVPNKWDGVLPRGVEIFLLLPRPPASGEILVFRGEKKDLASLRENWISGMNVGEAIRISATSEDVVIEDDIMMGVVTAEGPDISRAYRGFAAARCGPYGGCVICLGIAPIPFVKEVEGGVKSFIRSFTFSKPTEVSIYKNFDWREFLSDKVLISMEGVEAGIFGRERRNTIHLCGNGSFSANFQSEGFFKAQAPSYDGRQAGTWLTANIGEQCSLTLNFKKLPEAEVQLNISDEKIYINGERYFVAESDKCK